MKNIGIYIHIPFCERKCPYCDFYSRKGTDDMYRRYTDTMTEKITSSPYKHLYHADTLYFGGGTPGLLGAENIGRIVDSVRESFSLDTDSSEVTVEVNPQGESLDLYALRKTGANRLSVGLQSAADSELEFLGRKHSSNDARNCVLNARKAGFENISLDLMIALPGQTRESLKKSVDFCTQLNVEHLSAYILKIEEGTLFYRRKDSLELPDEDETADMYECLCGLMKENGYEHYEISNFSRKGFEGKHNLRYWHDEEYIGFGPSAHSFVDGKRFYCPRSMKSFENDEIIADGSGGDEEEYIMLGLRLAQGIGAEGFTKRFGHGLPEKYLKRCKNLEKAGYVKILGDGGFALTEKGFLVSNAIIAHITE